MKLPELGDGQIFGKSDAPERSSDMDDNDFDAVLEAFAPDADEALLIEMCQYRSDPGTKFDEALVRLRRRLAFLRARARAQSQAQIVP